MPIGFFGGGTGRAAVIRVLRTLGYRQADSAFPNIWEREGFLIDLHTSFLGDDRIRARTRSARETERMGEAEAGIWERVRPSTVGESFFVPAPEEHMLILCNHLMKHSFEPGPWFSDLEALLAAEPSFDRDATLERARAWGVLRSLAYAFRALGALEDEAGASCAFVLLPDKIRKTLNEVHPTRLDRMLLSIAAKGERLTGE
ncbi:MAG: nucleotidyltransferase family protein, partial [Nitrospinota bacterium]|nr:nucleotidyltransferase family protein [Nitrospinota bacterium]